MKKEVISNTLYDYTKIDQKVSQIAKKASKYLKKLDEDFVIKEIFKAYIFARDAHEWQMRLSGDPYIIHPVEATKILLQLQPDISTIQWCLLHDVAEDTQRTLVDIKKHFWKDVAFLCAWMEKLSKVRYTWEDRSVGSLRKMFIAMAEDLRVVFIKLSDRVHNMKTLKFHPNKIKRQRIALETLNIYSPIADRLWLFGIKNMLEEECFKILNPKAYKSLRRELKDLKIIKENFLEYAEKEIKKLLDEEGIKKYKLDYRIKSIYSIHKKIQKKSLDDATSLYDIFWIRVVLKDVEQCYRVLWLIHNHWTPLPQRFKDYIALPKPNGYKSLHTTVIGLLKKDKKQPAEIQIKTEKMHKYAEIWVAAHYEYKEKGSHIAQDIDWINELKELTNMWNNDFMSSLKIDVFNDRIFVFTPKWESINLPAGSTPIDFAYHLHSDLWDHITIAKVDGKVYPLDKELSNGNVIEIVIDKSRKPNPFWLSFVKTSKAKSRIRSFLKKEDKDMHRERWRDVMNRYLEKWWFGLLDKDFSLLKIIDWGHNTVEERWQLLEQVWNFSITPSNLMKRIIRSNGGSCSVKSRWTKKKEYLQEGREKEKLTIIIGWEEDVKHTLCFCCENSFPLQMIAHINSKWIITIHDRKCKILKNVNKDRLLPSYVEWTEDSMIQASLQFEVLNNIGVLHSITQTVSEMMINIEEIHQSKLKNGNMQINLAVEVSDYDYLLVDRLVERIVLKLWDKILSKKVLKITW